MHAAPTWPSQTGVDPAATSRPPHLRAPARGSWELSLVGFEGRPQEQNRTFMSPHGQRPKYVVMEATSEICGRGIAVMTSDTICAAPAHLPGSF